MKPLGRRRSGPQARAVCPWLGRQGAFVTKCRPAGGMGGTGRGVRATVTSTGVLQAGHSSYRESSDSHRWGHKLFSPSDADVSEISREPVGLGWLHRDSRRGCAPRCQRGPRPEGEAGGPSSAGLSLAQESMFWSFFFFFLNLLS